LLIPYEFGRGESRGPFFVSGIIGGMTIPNQEQALLEGAISVGAALQSGSREFHALMIRHDKDDGAIRHLERAARARGVAVRRVSADEIDAQAQGQTHGGVLGIVGPRRFVALEALLPPQSAALVVMIDGVEDPFNFGQAVRSLWAAGADGLVLRPRNWMSAAGVVARASAGASEIIPTAVAETAEDAAAFFRTQGLLVACATDDPPTTSLYETDLTRPLFLLVGGEKRGVTRSFARTADLRLRIPYARPNAHSLGTTAAAAVLAFEILRQRTEKHR
jgi:23S rRNA (guanosine2251-2'-O)-methyltransferase